MQSGPTAEISSEIWNTVFRVTAHVSSQYEAPMSSLNRLKIFLFCDKIIKGTVSNYDITQVFLYLWLI
jgi:hypothetical protein